jgi:hypothetical protein
MEGEGDEGDDGVVIEVGNAPEDDVCWRCRIITPALIIIAPKHKRLRKLRRHQRVLHFTPLVGVYYF